MQSAGYTLDLTKSLSEQTVQVNKYYQKMREEQQNDIMKEQFSQPEITALAQQSGNGQSFFDRVKDQIEQYDKKMEQRESLRKDKEQKEIAEIQNYKI